MKGWAAAEQAFCPWHSSTDDQWEVGVPKNIVICTNARWLDTIVNKCDV